MLRTTWTPAIRRNDETSRFRQAAIAGATLFALCAAAPGAAQQPSAAAKASSAADAVVIKGPVGAAQTAKVSGKVTAIDHKQRSVAIETDDGRALRMRVGNDVRNFDNVKKGDQVTIAYSEAMALALAKGSGSKEHIGEIRRKVESDAAAQAPAGGKPGVGALQRTTLVANVFDIDRDNNILTLRGTDGVPVDLKVSKDALSQVSKDDQLIVSYVEAAVVSIEPGKAADASATDGTKRKPATPTPKQSQ